jgi:beta-lactamase regulating signal transducer with metallopeptidase domain
MSRLAALLEQPFVEALGWALLHFIWQGTLIALLLAAVLRVWRRQSANARYLCACLALSLMAVSPVITMARLTLTAPESTPGESLVKETETGTSEGATQEIESAIVGTVTESEPRTAQPWQSDWAERAAPLLPWTALLWLIGVAFFTLRLVVGWRYTRRLRGRGIRPPEEALQERLRQLRRQLRITRPVRLLESALVLVPTAIGWLRPVILLPVGALTGLTPRQLEAIIAHELAHIRRHDYVVNLLQAVIETLLFYHPAVWWVSRRIRQEREHCCDDLAVVVCGDALSYARALFTMEQLRAAAPSLAMAANGGSLMNRIERLVGVQTQPRNHFTGWLAGLFILSILVSIGVGAQTLQLRPAQIAATKGPEAKAAASPGRFAPPRTTQRAGLTQREQAASLTPLPASLSTAFPTPAREMPEVTDEPSARSKSLGEPSMPGKSVQRDLAEREETTNRYQLPADARITISYILGSVEIEATDSDQAEVYIVRSANSKADLEGFDRIKVEQSAAGLELRGEDSKSNGIEIRHHLRLRLPRSSRLSLREINGRVHINGMEGAIQLNEVNGGAVIPHLSGELKMTGINGGIKLGLRRLAPGGIHIRDVTSGVELQVADGINAKLEITELDNQPLIEIPHLTLQQVAEKNFEGQLGVGGPTIRIVDVNGRVRIRST